MTAPTKPVLLILIVLPLVTAMLTPPSASASFTCALGVNCKVDVLSDGSVGSRWSLSVGSTSFTCALTGSIPVNDLDSLIDFFTLAFTGCTNNAGCSTTTATVNNGSPPTWELSLSSSTPLSANSWPLSFAIRTIGGLTVALSGCFFGTSGNVTIAGQFPTCTPGSSITTATTSMVVSCSKISYTATGAPAALLGSSGTKATMTVTLTYKPASGSGDISIS
jgi:hypothetical protein